MKNLLLFAILCYGLQFTSCKTTGQAFATPQYPHYAELHHGNYGNTFYQASTERTQAMAKAYYTYCDTARINGQRQIAPVPVPAPALAVAIAQ